MIPIGTNPAQAAAAAESAHRVQTRDRKPPEKPTVGTRRQGDMVTIEPTEVEAVRAVGGNGDEDAHQDRQRQGFYQPPKPPPPPPEQAHIDVNG